MANVQRLRMWFASLGILTVLVVAGFYGAAKLEQRRRAGELPPKLDADVQQSSNGFTFSKSEGGRTLFTIHATKVVQRTQDGKASLKDVNIIVYGRESRRFDQIYGNDFEYDPQAGTVAAVGEVHIELQGNVQSAQPSVDQPPQELKNPIHLRTDGLVFNQKTGMAHTDGVIEFRVPQASGRAHGATYDSKTNQLTLEREVELTTGMQQTPSKLVAQHGYITKEPRQVVLNDARLEQPDRTFTASRVEINLSDENDVRGIVGSGDVQVTETGANSLAVRAPRASLEMGDGNVLRSVLFSGGVQFTGRAKDAISGHSQRLKLEMAGGSRLARVDVLDDVHVWQTPAAGARNAQKVEIQTSALALNIKDGKQLHTGETSGPGTITLNSAQNTGERTVITAQRFNADFDSSGRISQIRGEPEAKVVSHTPGKPDRTSTSRTLLARFAPGGGLSDVVQEGSVNYYEPAASAKELGGRHAQAGRARYSPDDDTLTMTGAPRLVDGGMTVTADSIRVNRSSGDAFAQGSVKTTYSELRQEPAGALLATADPVHVTSSAVSVQRLTGIARYTGGARLWQGANAVEAPTIEFDRQRRALSAEGSATRPVTSVFVQVDKKNNTNTMVVSAARLTYVDATRRAVYTGGVRARGSDMNITAQRAEVLLHAAGQKVQSGPSQLDQIIAQQQIVIQQSDRRATGDRLVYTSADGAFVLTGGPPTLVDPEHGTLRGDALTFYSRDDRVVVAGEGTSRTVTRAHVNR